MRKFVAAGVLLAAFRGALAESAGSYFCPLSGHWYTVRAGSTLGTSAWQRTPAPLTPPWHLWRDSTRCCGVLGGRLPAALASQSGTATHPTRLACGLAN